MRPFPYGAHRTATAACIFSQKQIFRKRSFSKSTVFKFLSQFRLPSSRIPNTNQHFFLLFSFYTPPPRPPVDAAFKFLSWGKGGKEENFCVFSAAVGKTTQGKRKKTFRGHDLVGGFARIFFWVAARKSCFGVAGAYYTGSSLPFPPGPKSLLRFCSSQKREGAPRGGLKIALC